MTDVHSIEFVTAQNATADAVTPALNQIKDILSNGITSLKGLSGQPKEAVLASPSKRDADAVSGSLDGIAAILANILNVSSMQCKTIELVI